MANVLYVRAYKYDNTTTTNIKSTTKTTIVSRHIYNSVKINIKKQPKA